MKTLILSSLAAVAMVAPAATAQNPRRQMPQDANSSAEKTAGPITAARIRASIDDAVLFLRKNMSPDGSVRGDAYQGGVTAMAVLAILAAGGDPKADDQLAQSLDWLAKQEPNNTYVRGLRANVWEYALRKMPYDQNLRNRLKADHDWLLQALGDREGWRYTMESRDWDNSCTQYGVLGLWAAARAGFEPGDKFWLTMSKHFRSCQCDDGGWGYTGRSGSTPNMATAGLASMFLVYDIYYAQNIYRADCPVPANAKDAEAVLKSIERGMEWLGKCQQAKAGAYYLYGIERTGVASGRKTIGGEDWFAAGVKAVLSSQAHNGSIGGGSDFHSGGIVGSTALSTLFMIYGGAPIAINKLQYGDGQDWNLNPRDIANLSKHLWNAYERPINWMSVPISAEVAEFEAPILFISGAKAANFTDAEVAKLRTYILRGGTLFAEPSDHQAAFTRSMEDLARRLFPAESHPDWMLERLPANHGIFTVLKQSWPTLPKLRGVSDGSRTVFILSDEYLSADWQANRSASDAYKLATNLLFYATDLGELEGRFASLLPDTAPAKPRETAARIARVRFEGTKNHPADWDAASQCWQKFAPVVTHLTGRKLDEAPAVRLGQDKLDGIRLLHLTGRQQLTLAAAEREALKQYVADGGTVLVDAYAGSPEFADSARAELEAVFGQLQPLAVTQKLAEGRFEGGTDLAAGIAFKLPARQLLRQRGEEPRGQKLLVANQGTRPAVIYSQFDLVSAMAGVENYRSLGYKPESARKIVGNLMAYIFAD